MCDCNERLDVYTADGENDGYYNEVDSLNILFHHQVYRNLILVDGLLDKNGEAKVFWENELLPALKDLKRHINNMNILSRQDGGFVIHARGFVRTVPHEGCIFYY